MYRIPAREMCLNTIEDVYQTCKILILQGPWHVALTLSTDEESRPAAAKVLKKWRPDSTVLEETEEPEASAAPAQPEAQPAVAAEQ